MSSQKPVYVLLGGVCHTPAFMTPLIAELQKLGYDATAVAYATMGPNIETAEQWDDVRAVQDAVSHIVDEQQRDVILMLHSYGGWVGSRAVKGLDKETREKNGKKNGIMEVVFLAAFLIPDNAEIAKHAQQPEWLTFENGLRFPNEKAIPNLFSNLEPAEQKRWFSEFRAQRHHFSGETSPDAPWHLSVPKTYIVITDDQTMVSPFQLGMLQGVIDSTWSIKSMKGGHEPFLNRPAELAKVLTAPTY